MKKLISFLSIALILMVSSMSCSSSKTGTEEQVSKGQAEEEAKAEITEANVEEKAGKLLKQLEEETK